ncbi:PaaI family thioesterase [Siccirubricoccus sp. KC 17139]|uniref:PaaI family thioesterase n=1 Tax=Siccirubricoccus soli TaxID=2899147 RepID=A0ABT1CZY9_9PROT|nr:PaaI family thioesterase [Siccirubricoccus soli]MCO6415231.1 PaaI family thioesterase [Siccirubricoccus soli]MCP2681362.1 PaaI family thioesterase [Siccirubricoccus soli]
MTADSVARLQRLVDRSPHNSWLGMQVVAAGADGVEIRVAWREEFISAPERRAVHGGVLAGLVDSGAVFAVMAAADSLAATVDLRVDYHAIPASAPLVVKGRLIRQGRSLCTAEGYVYDVKNQLVASGRATVIVLKPKVDASSD